jgi:S-adenosylmethionine:tRNA ribosyltransferase-isomerase
LKTELFDFILPESLIAAYPASPRDTSRMLVVDECIHDAAVADITKFLKAGDIMVFNDTRVLPARLFGMRGQARVEILLHKRQSVEHIWRAFAKPGKRLKPADKIEFAPDFHATVLEKLPTGEVVLRFDYDDKQGIRALLERYGHMPLPPYIEKQRAEVDEQDDKQNYQTVYAKHDGSVAAPTAGLHFSEKLLSAIDAMGVKHAHVTLHVGGGTFLPVKAEDTSEHVMHSEYAVVAQETADAVNNAKAKGGRVIAVGTTSLRTLESATDEKGILHPFASETSIFITPGYRFKMVDMLLTNFHLPRSTLFMLVSAFSGLEKMKAAYQHAIEHKYRFYSYGDACLLFPEKR